jgi:hypothetical protein
MRADQVDVVEILLIDCIQLRIRNIPAEMGLKSELKYNRNGVAKTFAVVGIGCLALMALAQRGRQ